MRDDHPCLYCGHRAFNILHAGIEDRLRFIPGKRDWLVCKNCGSGILSPFPDISEIPGFYPPVYTFGLKQDQAGGTLQRILAQLEFQAFYRPQYEAQAQRILRLTRVPKDGNMIDIGCGRGLRILSFRRLGMNVHGMDLIPEPVEYVKKELGIPAICTDMAGLPRAFEPGTFDLVTAFQVIEHVPDVNVSSREPSETQTSIVNDEPVARSMLVPPKDKAVGITETVRRVSVGAADHVPFAQVTNLARTMEKLKAAGLWLVGTSDHAKSKSIYELDLKGPLGLVLGAEEKGMRRLTEEHCDFLAFIPMAGKVECLNVSVATGVCLFEAVRQRRVASE